MKPSSYGLANPHVPYRTLPNDKTGSFLSIDAPQAKGRRWPQVRILLSADAGSTREALLIKLRFGVECAADNDRCGASGIATVQN